ncbi:beta-glucosidase [Talaromyces islandicus]|uniref:Probable beta-glucosidase G n=1 Tax=Talaromyces islandicus TaxID=28573 RepID=A0A0U1LXJ1_TALIS|nr:beta-glucosidase [Talaromyces islandicus]
MQKKTSTMKFLHISFLLTLLNYGVLADKFTTPDNFPSPHMTGDGNWAAAFSKAKDMVSKLSTQDKASLVTGYDMGGCNGNIKPIESVGFTGLCLQDGPAGIRLTDLSSTFPAGLTAAASWDKSLLYKRAYAMASEFHDKGAQVLLGPVAGPLGRHPLGGRNWEGFSPDPYLAGVAMAYSVRGIQDTGVQASAKHFIGNEQETQRSNTLSPNGTNVDAISSNIDDRTMHELYLWPFADAVKTGVANVMCSYNRVNQTYACENSKLLNGLLKGELGFQGYVVSDWHATHSGVRAIQAGLDMNMPGPIDGSDQSSGDSYFGQSITTAVNNGTLSEERLDDMARRVLTPYFFLGQDHDYRSVDPSSLYLLSQTYGFPPAPAGPPPLPARDVRKDHAKLIRDLGAAGVVLLKNTNGTLPLQHPSDIGIFGNDAADLSDGTGRSTHVVSPLQGIRARTDAHLQYILDNQFISTGDFTSIYPVPDVCLVFLKTWVSEGSDRLSFENDWNSTTVVNNVASMCPNTVVVTHSGGVNTMPWASNPNVTAILAAHFPGQESGHSIADVLFGDVNPSGRLPYTIPLDASDYDIPVVNISGRAAYDSSAWQADFTEGLLIDYRHFDAKNITPLFEFGFGLSYTSFDLDQQHTVKPIHAIASPFPSPTTNVTPGGNPDLYTELFNVTTAVKNTGTVPGATVLQLYVSLQDASVPDGTPVKVLRGFEKVHLDATDAASVSFTLTRRDLSFWNTTAQDWQIPTGEATVSIGFSSRDLRSTTTVHLL